jgi:hypothetical protein
VLLDGRTRVRAAPTSVVITDSPAAGSGIVIIAARRFRECRFQNQRPRLFHRCSKYSRVLTLHSPKPPPQREISKAVAAGTNTSHTIVRGEFPVPSSNGSSEAPMRGWFRALMPKEEHFFDLFARMLRSRLPARKRSAQMRSRGEDVIRYCREIAPCVGTWPPTSSWPGSWRCRQQRCSGPPYLQTSFLVRPAGVTLPRSIALCDDSGRPVHGGVNE